MAGEHLNISIVEQMDSESLHIWRNNIINDLGKLTTFLTQIDRILEQRGER